MAKLISNHVAMRLITRDDILGFWVTSVSRLHGGDSPVGGDKQEKKGMKILPNECKGMTMVTRGHAVITGRSDMRSI